MRNTESRPLAAADGEAGHEAVFAIGRGDLLGLVIEKVGGVGAVVAEKTRRVRLAKTSIVAPAPLA